MTEGRSSRQPESGVGDRTPLAPGNIMYLVTRGALEIPGEVRMQVGDARWARANTFDPGEVAERDGVEFIFLQAGTNDHAVWWGSDTPAAATDEASG